jgi:hypothetical protein
MVFWWETEGERKWKENLRQAKAFTASAEFQHNAPGQVDIEN